MHLLGTNYLLVTMTCFRITHELLDFSSHEFGTQFICEWEGSKE